MAIPLSLTKIFPKEINDCLNKVGVTVNEIRLRVNCGLLIKSGIRCFNVNAAGITGGEGYRVSKTVMDDIFFAACDRSVYAYAHQIKNGCITLQGGVRLGLCGTAVVDGGEMVTQRDISGINVRIACEVKGCASQILNGYNGRLKSTLLIAPPYCGKTTILRDIACNLNGFFGVCSALLVDERNEISGSTEGTPAFNMPFVDVVAGCPKGLAIENIIRSMSPEVIIMDEIFEHEIPCLMTAANCGIKIFASLHGESINQAVNRIGADKLSRLFEKYYVLSNRERIGRVERVYDERLVELA